MPLCSRSDGRLSVSADDAGSAGVSPVIIPGVEPVDPYAAACRYMGETVVAHVNADMIDGFSSVAEKNKVALHEFFPGNNPAEGGHIGRCSRHLELKGLLIKILDESRAVEAVSCSASPAVSGSHPILYGGEKLLDRLAGNFHRELHRNRKRAPRYDTRDMCFSLF